jgi:hypothetical protein
MRSWLAAAIASLTVVGHSPAQPDLDALIRQADVRRLEYTGAFKELIAVETRLTELFDKDGRVRKQRLVVSDFLVYSSTLRDGAVAEYRVPREVDGKALRNPERDAIETFSRLADSKTADEERERLQALLLKYVLKYATAGFTLYPLGIVAEDRRTDATFAIEGREAVGGRDAVVTAYERQSWRSPREPRGAYRHFADPRIGNRGRAWLDASNGRLLRWENDILVRDRDITTPAPYLRTTVEYEPSAFGIWTPRRIVASFYDKARERKAPPVMRLDGRITYTYGEFKRFSVSTSTKIGP